MCNRDIASAFRSVSIHLDHRKFQGLSWETDVNVNYLS